MMLKTWVKLWMWGIVALLGLLGGHPALAQDAGQVQIPLDAYEKLISGSREPAEAQAPVGISFGRASVSVEVAEASGGAQATVTAQGALEVLRDGWGIVPLLPLGTALLAAEVDGQSVSLINTPEGMAWPTQGKGKHTTTLRYSADARRAGHGYVLALPLPRASSVDLTGQLPGKDLDVALIPATGVRTQASGEVTSFQATLPGGAGVQISWRAPTTEGYALGRARYVGELKGEAVEISATLGVELMSDEPLTLNLLPSDVTLRDVKVDGREAAILTNGTHFATLVKGRGTHTVEVGFQVPVLRGEGPPHIDLKIPAVPVSRFDLTLPGKKEVTVSPATNVTASERGASTLSTFFVPLTEGVSVAWAEAVPEEIKTEVRTNASIYHLAHAEEGVLYVRALVLWEITRGETSSLEIEVPADVQVNKIEGVQAGVSDWRLTRGAGDAPSRVTLFLDRKVAGELQVDITYERQLPRGEAVGQADTAVEIPLISAVDVGRQRGMVSLLASREIALKPAEEVGLTLVGENQLPAWVRQAVDKTINHTWKYADGQVSLTATAAPPERTQGRYDAQVDTLISIGDVTMRGAATVELDVKSGTLMELTLAVPAGINVLSLAAPSLRAWKVEPAAAGQEAQGQHIDVQFTQDMEGQFRIEVGYERIMAEGEAVVAVPTIGVGGAEVEQGRIAVEALTAVEVQPDAAVGLSTVDTGELPRQLILKTTNPILLAWKYVKAGSPPQLSLKVTRHAGIDVQDAIIDQALYKTLYTADGLAVTSARWWVRNSRKQFLKVALPTGSEVWRAWVDGQEEKPALAQGEDGDRSWVLIKILSSTEAFPVDLIYTTPADRLRDLGRVSGELPRPDMIATQSRWDVYVPDTLSYREPRTNMRVLEAEVYVSAEGMAQEIAQAGRGAEDKPVQDSLRIMVPTAGIRFSFEKLYANQSADEAVFDIPYASSRGAWVAAILSVLGAALAVGAALRWVGRIALGPRPYAVYAGGVGLALVWGTVWGFGAPAAPPLLILGGAGAYLGLGWARARYAAWGVVAPEAPSSPDTPPPPPSAPPAAPPPAPPVADAAADASAEAEGVSLVDRAPPLSTTTIEIPRADVLGPDAEAALREALNAAKGEATASDDGWFVSDDPAADDPTLVVDAKRLGDETRRAEAPPPGEDPDVEDDDDTRS